MLNTNQSSFHLDYMKQEKVKKWVLQGNLKNWHCSNRYYNYNWYEYTTYYKRIIDVWVKIFCNTLLGFTKTEYGSGSWTNEKPVNISGNVEIHLICDWDYESFVNGWRQHILLNFASKKLPGRKIKRKPGVTSIGKIADRFSLRIFFLWGMCWEKLSWFYLRDFISYYIVNKITNLLCYRRNFLCESIYICTNTYNWRTISFNSKNTGTLIEDNNTLSK